MKYLYVFILLLFNCCSITNNTEKILYVETIDTTSFKNYSLIKTRNKNLEKIYLFAIKSLPIEKSQEIELNKSYLFVIKKYSYNKNISLRLRGNTPNAIYIDDENSSVIWSSDSLEQEKIMKDIKIYYALNVKNPQLVVD